MTISSEPFTVDVGPGHPSTHGVFRIELLPMRAKAAGADPSLKAAEWGGTGDTPAYSGSALGSEAPELRELGYGGRAAWR